MEQKINDFWIFCHERELIRQKKDGGMTAPWTRDPILQKHKFTNIDRAHDRGTRLLWKLCRTLCQHDMVHAVVIYRMSGSLNTHIDLMQANEFGKWYEQLGECDVLFNMTAYQALWPKGKGNGIKFLLNDCKPIVDEYYQIIQTFKHATIIAAADALCDILVKHGYKRMSFQATEISKDISCLNDTWIDPDSVCHLGGGAIKGLKYIFGTANRKNIDILMADKKNIYNYSALEHGLCEYSKYMDYKLGIRKPHNKLYQYNKFDDLFTEESFSSKPV